MAWPQRPTLHLPRTSGDSACRTLGEARSQGNTRKPFATSGEKVREEAEAEGAGPEVEDEEGAGDEGESRQGLQGGP